MVRVYYSSEPSRTKDEAVGRHNVSSTEPSTMNSGVFGVLFTILGARVVSQDRKFFLTFI